MRPIAGGTNGRRGPSRPRLVSTQANKGSRAFCHSGDIAGSRSKGARLCQEADFTPAVRIRNLGGDQMKPHREK